MAKYCSSKMVGMDHEGIAKSIVKKRMMNKGGMVEESDEDEGFLEADMPEESWDDQDVPDQEDEAPMKRKALLGNLLGAVRMKNMGRK